MKKPNLTIAILMLTTLVIAIGCSTDDISDDGSDDSSEDNADEADASEDDSSPDSEDDAEDTPVYLTGSDDNPGTIVEIYTPTTPNEAMDLEFHPERDELWVVNRDFEVEGLCTAENYGGARCRSLEGYTTIIFEPGTENQDETVLKDGNAWHFMRRPPSLAMGVNDTFATCGEAATGNFEDELANFIGPSLWSSDLDIYAQDPGFMPNGQPLNGSHLDMLHATPWCMGIAHERDNVYWAFNGELGSIDRYDFASDHGPGWDDHSDGMIYRYAPNTFSRVANVPSHMVFNHDDDHLYIADTGLERILKLDTTSGTYVDGIFPVYEPLADMRTYTNVDIEIVIGAGEIEAPSGMALHDNTLYIGDNSTGEIHAYTLDGDHLHTLDTGLEAGALAGLAVGPQNRLWFTDMNSGRVFRVDTDI